MNYRRLRLFFGILASILVCGGDIYSQPIFTLKDAVHKALETTYAKNSQLMGGVVKLNREIEEHIYEPDYTMLVKGSSDQSEKGNPFIPDTEIAGVQLGVDQLFKTGTTLTAKADVFSQSQQFVSLDDIDYFETAVSVGVEQDIWRNAFGVSDRAELKRLDIVRDIEIAEITDLLEETVYQSTVIFWALVLSERQVEVSRQAMANAKTLYDHEVRKSRTGLSEIRIVEAVKANWLLRKVGYDQAVANYEAAKDQFLTVLDIREMPEISDNSELLMPLIHPPSFEYNWITQSSQMRRYQSALLLKDAHDIDALQALEKAKPKLVVFARTGFNGIDESLGDSMSDFVGLDHMSVEGGVKLTFSGGKQPLYAVKRAQLQKAIQENNIEMLTQDTQLELKNSSRQVALLKSVTDDSQQVAESLARKYKEDLRQFDVGRLSIDELIQSQDRHLESQLDAIKSKYQYLQAVCRHFRVDNTLLSKIAFLKEQK